MDERLIAPVARGKAAEFDMGFMPKAALGGWEIRLTSRAAQQALNITASDFGILMDDHCAVMPAGGGSCARSVPAGQPTGRGFCRFWPRDSQV